jgi:peptidoglycan hydrolase-like protein with peptidoglycan-binding domain
MRFALIRLQTDHSLVKNPADSNAGYYGPSTRKVLKKAYEAYLADKARADSEIAAVLLEIVTKAKAEAAEAQKIRLSLEGVGIPKAGESGAHVRSLQEALSKLGYFDRKSTGIFGAKTREAVARFQIDSGLVSGMNDPNAGKFGNRTKTKLLLSLAEKGVISKK